MLGFLKLYDRPLIVSVCASSVLIAACGGGQDAPLPFAAASVTNTATTSTTVTTSAPNAKALSVTLGNLPDTVTPTTAAAITYEPPSTGTVYCRLDRYTPIACPNPFVLGQSSALAAGTHSVDYYLDTGSGIDLANPSNSYSWTIEATTVAATTPSPTTTTTTATSTATTTPVSGTALRAAHTGLATWGIDAPATGDGTNFPEKAPGGVITSLSQFPTITNDANGGGTRFGPTTVDGLPALLLNVRQGDPTRYNGNRSALNYDGFQLKHGHDYWFAFAFKLGSEWTVAQGGGNGDRQNLFDTHQQSSETTSGHGNPFSLSWEGTTAGQELVWRPDLYDGSGSPVMYRAASQPNVWTRVIIHYRSGSSAQNPNLETWIAYGTGSFTKLTPLMSSTTPFGDPAQTTFDWPVAQIYKWTTGSWGTATNRTVYNSGLFAQEGTSLYDGAVAALAAYAR
jgi:hypothetical protein